MGTTHHFALPDVGEGLTEAEVVTWLVATGDVVAVNDPIVEVETAKSVVELPSPFAGVVTGLLVEEGMTVPVGTPLFAVADVGDGDVTAGDGGNAGEGLRDAGRAPDGQAGSGVEGGPVEPVAAERSPVLVGYGPRASSATPPRRRRTLGRPGAPGVPAHVSAARAALAGPVDAQPPVVAEPTLPTKPSVLAKPPVRAMARDLGIDLRSVMPSGAGGIVTREDVLAHAAAPSPATSPTRTSASSTPAIESGVPPVTAPDRTTSRPTTAQSAAESAAAAAASAERGGERRARPAGVLTSWR